MTDKSMKFRIGLFVVAVIVVFGGLVVLFSGFPSFLTRQTRFTVLLSEAGGVGPGTPVRRSGVKIGEVSSVDLDNDTGLVRVGIVVDNKYTLRQNEEPVLNRGLLGDTTIDFTPKPANGKPPDTSPTPPGSVLVGKVPVNPQTLLNQIAEVLPTTQQTLIEIAKASDSINRLAPQLDAAAREFTALSREARAAIPDLRRTNDEAQVTLKNWGALGERLNVLLRANEDLLVKTLKDIDDAAVRFGRAFSDDNLRNIEAILNNTKTASDRFPNIAQQIEELAKESRVTVRDADVAFKNITKATQPLADRGDILWKNIDESSDRLNKVLMDAQELFKVINRSDGTFQRFIADPSLYNNLNDAACQVAKLMPRVERILKDFEVFADKVARHPETIGVGGAVRPSSGIK